MTYTRRRTARTLGLGLLLTGAAALLFSSSAEARPYNSGASGYGSSGYSAGINAFHRADSNGDSYLSSYELQFVPAYMRATLSGADYNYDGYISLAEAKSVLASAYVTPTRRYRTPRYTRAQLRKLRRYRNRRFHRRGRVVTPRRGRIIHRRGRAINRRRARTIDRRRGRVVNGNRGRVTNRNRGRVINRNRGRVNNRRADRADRRSRANRRDRRRR